MPPTRQTKPPASTRESVWFVVLWHTPNNGKTESVKYLFEGGEAIGFVFHNNDPSGFTNPRYFTKNLQGDIVSIYHHDYSHRVTYSYDAWGNPSVVSGVDGSQYAWLLGYRGYQYDKETGLYYCQSRYYNPRVARWLSGDKYFDAEYSETPLTSNVWAYANNNPVAFIDGEGTSAIQLLTSAINYLAEKAGVRVEGFGMPTNIPDIYENAPILAPAKKEKYVNIPKGKTGTFMTYMGYHTITHKLSNQYKLREKAKEAKRYKKKKPEYYAMIDNRIVIATKEKIGGKLKVNIGTYVDVQFKTKAGKIKTYKCIIGEFKGDDAKSSWGHDGGKSVVEIVYHDYKPPTGYNKNKNDPWGSGKVTKITIKGKYK